MSGRTANLFRWVALVVLVSGANLAMLERMDGTQLGSIEVAKDKAYSAVLYRRLTKALQDVLEKGGLNLRVIKLSGALPFEGASNSLTSNPLWESINPFVIGFENTPPL